MTQPKIDDREVTNELGSGIYPGLRVQTISGELDTDSEGEERHTPPGSWGWIESHNHADHWGLNHWDLMFPNGASVVVTETELRDAAQYKTDQSIKVHNFIGECPSDVYDRTQTDNSISDGDILNFGNGNIGILVQAWPTVVCGKIEHFHLITEGSDLETIDNGKYALSVEKARAIANDATCDAQNVTDGETEATESPQG